MIKNAPPVVYVDALPAIDELPAASRYSFALRVARNAAGADVYLPVNILVGAAAHPRLLMVAGVHGNEYEGITALIELWYELDPANLQGTIVMVPVANPPAFHTLSRRSPADDIDMNRIFPGDPSGSITHRLAYQLFHTVLPGSDLLLSMHGWTADGIVVPYVEYPRQTLVTDASRAAAVAFGLEYIEALDWLPGLFVTAANAIGIPAIEPEIGGQAVTLPERRMLYRSGCINLMRHIRILHGLPELVVTPRDIRRCEQRAPIGGLLLRHVEPGQIVSVGQPIASITDLNGVVLADLAAAETGTVASVRMHAAVAPDDLVAMIFV